MADGTLVDDAATVGQLQGTAASYAADVGAADAYEFATTPAWSAYAVGMSVDVKITNTNLTTTPTLESTGLDPGTIVNSDGSALTATALVAGGVYRFKVASLAATVPTWQVERTTRATTQAAGNNTTLLATTAFVAGALGGVALRSYLAGLGLSTAGSSATFGIAAGMAVDSTNVSAMALGSAYTKTTSAWALGTAAGSLDTGAIANNTWYHVFLIQRPDTGVVDVLTSLSPSAPTMPANYTLFRRIGSMKTNGSAQWATFLQVGDFFYIAQATDLTTSSSRSLSLLTLSVPTGVVLQPLISVDSVVNGTLAVTIAPGANNALTAQLLTQSSVSGALLTNSGIALGPPTNTSAQIYVGINIASTSTNFYTSGWRDTRGRDG